MRIGRPRVSGAETQLFYLILVVSTCVSLLGFQLYKSAHEVTHRNFQHLKFTQIFNEEMARNRSKDAQVDALGDALVSARAQAIWCGDAVGTLAHALLGAVRLAEIETLCDKARSDIETAQAALADYGAGEMSYPMFEARMRVAAKHMLRNSIALEPFAQAAQDRITVFVYGGTFIAVSVLFVLIGRFRVDMRRTIARLRDARAAALTSENMTREAEARLRAAVSATQDGFAIFSSSGRLVLSNAAFRTACTADPDRISPSASLSEIVTQGLKDGIFTVPDDTTPAVWTRDFVYRLFIDGETMDLTLSGGRHYRISQSRTDHGDSVVHLIDHTDLVRQRDLQEEYANALERANREIEAQALHDPLTGLPNRRSLDRRLSELETMRVPENVTLIRIDLDHFKYVNDTLGHAAGDFVLCHVAELLLAEKRKGDLAARVGGDEFVLLLDKAGQVSDADAIIARLRARIAEDVRYEGRICRFGASFGVASSEGGRHAISDLLSFADAALYRAKEYGRSRAELYTPELHAGMIENRKRADEIREGLERGEFVPFFQPQVDAETHALVGAEVLARWQHPRRGILAPDEFLEVADHINAVPDIDRAMFETAFAFCRSLADEGTPLPKISFNVSSGRIHDDNILDVIGANRTSGTKIAFELLESIFLEEESTTFSYHLDLLREAGISVEIDDFGSGRASIVGLMKIGADALKIDRRLITPITRSAATHRLVEAIVEIGNALEISVTAEGVETTRHAELLREIGCRTLQGYAFSRPIDAAQFRAYLAETGGSSSVAMKRA